MNTKTPYLITDDSIKFNYKELKLNDKKYQKILGNLLEINKNTTSELFSYLSNFNKDLNSFLTKQDIEIILNNADFKIQLNPDIEHIKIEEELKNTKNNIDDFFSKIKSCELLNKDQIQDWKNNIDNKQKSEFYKKIIWENLKKKKSNFLFEWKNIQKQIHTLYNETGIWPYYIATYFIQTNINSLQIQAPFILKKVDIEIYGNDVYLTSYSPLCELNEKLLFLLEQQRGINPPKLNPELNSININQLNEELNSYFHNLINNKDILITNNFNNDWKTKILQLEDEINKTSGIISMFCAATSGQILRKVILRLIKENKMDNLLHIDENYDIFSFKQNAINNLIIKKEPIVRICPTDPSQEKAIIQALNNSLIIIGPPGTGKSQTIANLLANILYKNKKALFISQKKVALDVVLERMHDLQYFCLQLTPKDTSINKNKIKEDFYKKLQKLFEILSETNNLSNIDDNITSLVSNSQQKYWDLKNKYSNLDENILNDFYNLCASYKSLNKERFLIIKQLVNDFKEKGILDKVNEAYKNQIGINIEQFATFFSYHKKGIFKKDYDQNVYDFFHQYEKFFNTLNESKLTYDDYLKLNQYFDNDIYLNLYDDLYKPFDTLPKLNNFVSNLKLLIKQQTNSFIHKINTSLALKNEYNKMKGKIDQGFLFIEKFLKFYENLLKNLFPIIVANPDTLSSFINFEKDQYDYVIFDEASQIFLEKAIPYLSIAKKVIIAGDSEQMQPTNWYGFRINDNDDENEISEEKEDSLLNYAISSGLTSLTLELNYRSNNASLTSFSSKEFYNSNLKSVDLNQIYNNPIEVIEVNGKWSCQTNHEEAIKMIELLKQNYTKYNKIILLTLNKTQCDYVNELLSKEPELYELIFKNRVILKNLENIQGDEADLVIISIAYTKNAYLDSTYVARSGGRNALNVAITRAKQKMIVLKSIKASEIKSSNRSSIDLDTFKRWLSFLELNSEQQKEYCIIQSELTSEFDSKFEKEVFEWLIKQKYDKKVKITNQYPVGSYNIDFAIVDADTNQYLLGLEVDGFKYHFGINKIYNDLVRQEFLLAKGYKIIRISEFDWKVHKEQLLQDINKNLINL